MGLLEGTYLEGKLGEAVDLKSDESKKKKFESAGGPTPDKMVKDMEMVSKIPHSKHKIQCLAWGPSKEDERMVIADQNGTVMVWDTVKKCRKFGYTETFTQSLALNSNKDNPMVLSGGMKNATMLFKRHGSGNDATLKATKTWIAHDGYISSVHFIDNDKYISSSGDADIRVFSLEAKVEDSCIAILRGHAKDCQSIKFPRDDASQNTFITCSSDKTVKVWDRRTSQCTMNFVTDSELNACSIFPDGNLIACGGEKDKTYVFDVRAYKEVGKYARNNMKTASCEFSKSGRQLFVGHDDGAIITWDIFGSGANKAYAKKTEAHVTWMKDKHQKDVPDTSASRVASLDVGPDGFLASAGFDGTVKIWGAAAPKA